MEFSSNEHNKMLKKPLLRSFTKGGFTTLPFIIANEAFEKVASVGLVSNMILYLTREYNMDAVKGANVLFYWTASNNFMPIIAAFLADSLLGRFSMIAFGSIASLLGMILLWLTTIIPQARPKPCDQFGKNCEPATIFQLLLLYTSFAFMSIGAGGIRSCSVAFGAEQLRQSDKYNSRMRETFFTWYYVAVLVSIITATTCIVYIQDAFGWKVGYGVPVLLMILSTVSFFLASPFYVESKPDSSLFTGFAQVVVASYKNRNVKVPSNARNLKYHHRNGSKRQVPTDDLRFLNKACIIANSEEEALKASDSWSVSTVDQVEELKRLIKIFPIWSSGVMIFVTLSQGSFAVIQASTLDRHFTTNFEIPAGSFSAFMVFTVVIWVILYDRVIIPVGSKLKGRPIGLTLKQKMGIGILFSSASMAAFAILEGVRRKTAVRQGFSDNPKAVLDVSAMWSLPHHIFGGFAEAFNVVGQNEFYYTELSKSMASVATSLLQLATSAGNLVSSFIVNTVNNFTKESGKESWVSNNINKGHYDYYFYLLAVLSLVNFMYYLSCCNVYCPYKSSGHKEHDENEGIDQ